ncbi:MAG: serine/threonine-protein kinase [Planctomycetota bacterium]|jgi:tetratricopeptide (TPR) repeat protein
MGADLQSLSTGDLLLDRFVIDASFQGGMGLLWTVTERQSGRRYAVKTTRPSLAGDPSVVDAFRREAETWIALEHHENLVQALWVIEDESPFLVLEYVGGRDLAAMLAERPLQLERALDLAMQIASGMAYAHARPVPGGVGVIHRDLKPSNLLVTPDDVLHVTDFGLARVFRESVRASGAEAAVAGTLAYMAPEQLHGPEAVDRRADIYAFGLVVHEMLTGVNPLLVSTVPDQIRAVLNTVPPPLHDVPDELRALISRCVAKDPDDRPRDFDEVLAQLAGIARSMHHDWHVDPDTIEAPAGPTSLVVEAPVLRPRRPRAGEPFAIELAVRGDVGPGPVEVVWECAAIDGAEILTPGMRDTLRVDVGGRIELHLRIRAVAPAEGNYRLPSSTLRVRGPVGEATHAVAPLDLDVAFAFHLPLVGRAAEMEVVREAVAEVCAGRGGLLLISGTRGSGRSRMLHECARLTGAADVRSVLSRAEGEAERPLRILNDAARELLALARGGARSVRAKINAVLREDPETAHYFAEVLLGGMTRDTEAPVVTHWHTLLREATKPGPLVLLLDDLHRADEAAARICFEIAARAEEAGLAVLVVATVASGVANRAAQRRIHAIHEGVRLWERRGASIRTIELDPLEDADVSELVSAVFEDHGFDEEAPWFVPTLADATGGNPFHLSEILRMLRRGEKPLLAREDGEWRATAEFTPERLRELVPQQLDAAVRRRLESLPHSSQEVCMLAAMIGEEFDAAVLRAAVGDDDRVERSIAEWESAGLVRFIDRSRDRYRFWSAVVPPVAERMQEERDPGERRRMHGRIADGMLRIYRDENERSRRALGIAHHLWRAHRPEEALPFTLAGCRRLLGLALSSRARQILEMARSSVEQPGVDPMVRARFDFLYGIACEDIGAYEEGKQALERFLERAREHGHFRRRDLARAYRRLGRIHQAQGDYDDAALAYETSRAMLEEVGDFRAVAFLHCSMGALALDRGDLVAAQRSIRDALELAKSRGNEGATIQALILDGRLALRLRDHARAREGFAAAEDRARALGDRRRRAIALQGLARVDLSGGYLSAALDRLGEAIDLHAVMGDRAGLAEALVLLGDVHRDRGRSDLALHNYRRAERVFREIGRPEGEAAALLQAGRVLRLRAKTTLAVRDVARAAETFSRIGHPGRARALLELAFALAESGAERPARLALARADRAAAPGSDRRIQRVVGRALRARFALARKELRLAGFLAERARRFGARTPGHGARIVAYRIAAEVAARRGDFPAARRNAETALAFAQEGGFLLEAAAAERVLLELDAAAGRTAAARARAHRIARIYAQRSDSGGESWRLLCALQRGFARKEPKLSAGYARAAARCRARLEAQGFRAAE